MNFNEENPGNPCGRDGQSSSAEFLKQLMTELGALLHAHPQHGGIVINYYNSVGQRIDSVNTQNFATDKWLSQFVRDKTSRPTLPDALNTSKQRPFGTRRKRRASLMNVSNRSFPGLSRLSWPTRWPNDWASRRSGRCLKHSGIVKACITTITKLSTRIRP